MPWLPINALTFSQVHKLSPEKLAKREVVHVDIVNDPVSSQVSLTATFIILIYT